MELPSSSSQTLSKERLFGNAGEAGLLTAPLDSKLARITHLAKRALGLRASSISLFNAETETLLYCQGFDPGEFPIKLSLSAPAGREGRLLTCADTHLDSDLKQHPLVIGGPKIRALIATPIFLNSDHVVGCLWGWRDEPSEFGYEEKTTLEDLAALATGRLGRRQESIVHEKEISAIREQAIRISQVYAAGFKESPEPALIVHLESGEITEASKSLAREVGVSRKELIGTDFTTLPDFGGRVGEAVLRGTLDEGFIEQMRLEGGGGGERRLSSQLVEVGSESYAVIHLRNLGQEKALTDRITSLSSEAKQREKHSANHSQTLKQLTASSLGDPLDGIQRVTETVAEETGSISVSLWTPSELKGEWICRDRFDANSGSHTSDEKKRREEFTEGEGKTTIELQSGSQISALLLIGAVSRPLNGTDQLFLHALGQIALACVARLSLQEGKNLIRAKEDIRLALQQVTPGANILFSEAQAQLTDGGEAFTEWGIAVRDIQGKEPELALEALASHALQGHQFLKKAKQCLRSGSRIDTRLELRGGYILRCRGTGIEGTDETLGNIWHFEDITRLHRHQSALELAARAGAAADHEAALLGCVRGVARGLGTRYAIIARASKVSEGEIDILTAWDVEEKRHIPDFPACSALFQKLLQADENTRHNSGLQTLYPEDNALKELGIDACLAAPLHSATDAPEGFVAALHTSPIPHAPDLQDQVLGLFAALTSADLIRVQAEGKLDNKQGLLKQIIDTNPNPISIKDREGRFTLINKALADLYGGTPESMIGTTDQDYACLPEEADNFRKSDLEVMQSLKTKVIPEEPITAPSGQRWLRTIKRPLVDSNGKASHVLVISTDITKRRATDKALEWQLAKAKLLEQITREIRSSLDLEQVFQTAVTAIGKTFNASRVHLHAYVTKPEPGIPLVAKYMEGRVNSVLGIEIPFEGNAHVQRVMSQDSAVSTPDVDKDDLLEGSRHLVRSLSVKSMLAVRTSYRGHPNGIIMVQQCGSYRDWTPEERELIESLADQVGIAMAQADLMGRERERRRELAGKNEDLVEAKKDAEVANVAKSEFLARMSHELRTPLNAILGFTQLLEMDTDTTAQQQETLGIINRSGEHLLDLINDVLQVSKIEAGQVTLHPKPFDLDALLDAQVAMFEQRASSSGIALSYERAPDLPRFIITDEGKLRQVISNLCSNALKFTTEGEVVIRARPFSPSVELGPSWQPPANTDSERSGYLLFEVEDTGSGISEEETEKIFESFAQTDIGRDAPQGAGLGLAICRQFVTLLGGEIVANSKIGVGSCFSFYIRFEPVAGDTADLESQGEEVLAPVVGIVGNGSYRILVVDDQKEARSILKTLLQRAGFETAEAENGKEALAFFRSWSPDAILMDMQMPVMDGFEATRQIKAQLGGQKVPIIALTASAFEDARQRAMASGCDAFIPKPFKMAELFSELGKQLDVEFIRMEPAASAARPSGAHNVLPAPITGDIPPLSANELAALSKGWLDKLESAATQLDLDSMETLLGELNDDQPQVAAALQKHTTNFNYEPVLAFIRKTRQNQENHPADV